MTDPKAVMRKQVLARRKTAFEAGDPMPAVHRLLRLLEPHRGKPVAGYMPMRSEIDPLPAMTALSAANTLCVPVVQGPGQPLLFKEWFPGCAMEKGAFGALIPTGAADVVPDILIVPLVAFDRAGGRLGYGGGFYDRTLERLRAQGPLLAFGFAYSAQEADSLPLEETDQPLDAIVTDAEILRF